MYKNIDVQEISNTLIEQWDDGLISSVEVCNNINIIIAELNKLNFSINNCDILNMIDKLNAIKENLLKHIHNK